jgi:hypothetical protein
LLRAAVFLTILAASPAHANGRWQTIDTPHFHILHVDPVVASRVAAKVEKQRAALLRYWGSPAAAAARWNPRCTIYLFANNRELVTMTGGDAKAGSSLARQSRLMHGKVFSRRINLAADDHQLISATLPHEISHVVLKDLVRDIPRWADEGTAMYAEAVASMKRRARSLRYVVKHGPFYRAETLMKMVRYPDQSYIHLYYAQSYALTRMFIEWRGPRAFLRFLRIARSKGTRHALWRIYQTNEEALQRRYLAYARKLAATH